MLKGADAFIANLWDLDGRMEITIRYSSPNFAFYNKEAVIAVVVKESLDVENIMAELINS